jgi:hypothetical protein
MNMFKPNTASSPEEYIEKIDEPRKSQIRQLHEFILKTLPKQKPFMISGMIGYGMFHYKSKSGREGDWCLIALASQKNYISLYACSIANGEYVAEKYKKDLPRANIGKSCIRFKKVEDVDLNVIKKLLIEAEKYGGALSV